MTSILWILLVVWGALLFGGLIFGKPDFEATQRIPRWARIGSSLALVAAGWGWYLGYQSSGFSQLTLFIALGMTLGFVGDLFMASLIRIGDRVLGGIAAFGIGHVFYIIGLVSYGNAAGYDDPSRRWGSVVVWLAIGVVLWYLVVFRRAEKRMALHFAALPYSVLLALTTAFATGLALQTGDFLPVAIGATLFLTSDLILAAQLFGTLYFRGIGDIIWLTYGPGQMLIVYGVPLMLALAEMRQFG